MRHNVQYRRLVLKIRWTEVNSNMLSLLRRNVTHCAPFPRHSSPIATPRSRISRRLKVDATLIPVGKPVAFFTKRRPAGPSWKQIDGIPRRSIAVVSPTQRPNWIFYWFFQCCGEMLTRRTKLPRSDDNGKFLVDGHLGDGIVCQSVGVVPRSLEVVRIVTRWKRKGNTSGKAIDFRYQNTRNEEGWDENHHKGQEGWLGTWTASTQTLYIYALCFSVNLPEESVYVWEASSGQEASRDQPHGKP